MADEDRAKEIIRLTDHLVKPGEAWMIRKESDDESTEAYRQDTSSLSFSNPELYGRLLRVSEQLSNAGGALCIWGPIAVLVFCVGLHLKWFDGVLGDATTSIRSIWFYLLATLVSFFLFGGLARIWERFTYRRYRDAILRAIDDAKMTPHQLIADIERDEALSNLADQLKADPRLA